MRYLIIGGGPAATSALETIRQYDPEGTVALVSDEPAHARMALPYWLNGKIAREQTYTADEATWEQLGVEAHIGRRAWLASRDVQVIPGATVTGISVCEGNDKHVELADGRTIDADVVVLATGVRPNLGLVENTSIRTDLGILVDDHLRTNVEGICRRRLRPAMCELRELAERG